MSMSNQVSVIVNNMLHHQREVRELAGSIASMLGDLADCEGEAECRMPQAARIGPSEGPVRLLYLLRRRLAENKPGQGFLALAASTTFPAAEVVPLRTQSDSLQATLDDILELAEWSGWQASTWAEIESRFCKFSRNLSDHLTQVGDVICQTTGSGDGVPKAATGD